MTEREEALLCQALIDAILADEAEAPDEPVSVSARHARQMRALCRDPLKWYRRRMRPIWKRALQTAAMVALICAAAAGVLLAVSPSARASVRRWFVQYRETDIVYTYSGAPLDGDMPQYIIPEIPDGFVLEESFVLPDYVMYAYRCEAGKYAGQFLYFSYQYMHEGAATGILATEDIQIDVSINGHPGTLYLAHDPDNSSSTLIWFDEEANFEFSISAYLTGDELIALAESVMVEK